MLKNKTFVGLLILLVVLILVLCICSAVWLASYFIIQPASRSVQIGPPTPAFSLAVETATASPDNPVAPGEPAPQTPTILAPSATPTGVPTSEADLAKPGLADSSPVNPAQETLNTLENTLVPINDLVELAERLGGIPASSIQSTIPAVPLDVGVEQSFWVMNVNTNENFQVPARLVYLNDQVYFWVQDGVKVNENAVKKLADTFASKIVPTDRAFFGSEWNPGIDGDPRMHILYAKGAGNSVAGYFSSADEYPVQINKFSNAREMFLINADTSSLDSPFTYGVLAHEFQHMIHWYQDRNEETWINEGFADLAAFLNGYTVGGADRVYVGDTDIQLNDWPAKPDPAHYGAAFLFLTYFLDRFGEKATQDLVANPTNGLVSMDQVLAEINARDGITGKPIQADDVFIDWAVANYLQDQRTSDGRYAYHIYPTAPKSSVTEIVQDCPTGQEKRQVHQYGADAIRIRCHGAYQLTFTGNDQVDILPTEPHSGAYFFWSNQGDESDMTLTHAFDFSNVSGPITFDYSAWYDIEKGFDHVYLAASTDNGITWEIIKPPSGSLEDISGSGFGWSYTGQSNGPDQGWVQEQVDLSAFAGKEVLLRFEYVTDSAVNGNGFALDDVSIPAIGYQSDFETDAGGWQAQGFARVQNALPQTFRLALIEKGKNTRVSLYEFSGPNPLNIPFQIDGQVNEVTLIVAGTTRITRQEADYQVEITSSQAP